MFIEAQLVFKSYKPLKLEVGMLFLIQGQYEPYLHKLEKLPVGYLDDEDYFRDNGYPVEMYIVDPGNPNIVGDEIVIATPEQIGWFDEGDHADDVDTITMGNLNRIISGYNGYLLVEMGENEEDDYLYPLLYDNKVTIRYADLEDEYDDNDRDESDDDNENDYSEPNDDQIYNNFNHEGGIKF